MLHPYQRTLGILEATQNPLAIDLLVSGLHVADERIRGLSLGALLRCQSPRGYMEIIRGYTRFPLDLQVAIQRHAATLSTSVRQAVLNGDEELRQSALELIRRDEDYTQVPTLLNLIEDQEFADRDRVGNVVLDLAGSLHNHLHFGKEHASIAGTTTPAATFLRDAQRIRHQLISSLESACLRFDGHHCPAVVEALLALSEADDAALKKLLQETSLACKQAAIELLLTSRHPGVLSLIVQSLAKNHPLAEVSLAFRTRTDREFLLHLLVNWPRKLSAFQQKNLKTVTSFAWLDPARRDLDEIPAPLQKILVALIVSTGLADTEKLDALEWIVKHAAPDARVAATEVLVEMEDDSVKEVIVEGLDSSAPDVQAWATSQLRVRDVPHAFELLIERLDSPLPEVRETARAELGDFEMHRVLEMFEHLNPNVCLAVGRLVRKIDPRALEKLRHELSAGVSQRRIRAMRAALALGMQRDVADVLVVLLNDGDAQVRRTAAEVLGHVTGKSVISALAEKAKDPSPRVRDAITRSLHHLQELELHSQSHSEVAGSTT